MYFNLQTGKNMKCKCIIPPLLARRRRFVAATVATPPAAATATATGIPRRND